MSNILIEDYAASLPPLYGIKKWNFSPENWNNFIISLETIARFEKDKAREHIENEKSMTDHSNYCVAYQNAKNIFYSMLPTIKSDYYAASNDMSLVVEDTESNNSENESDISSDQEEEQPQVIPYYAWEVESNVDALESHCESTSKPKMENVNYDNNGINSWNFSLKDWDILITILETIKKLENKSAFYQQTNLRNRDTGSSLRLTQKLEIARQNVLPIESYFVDQFALKICCTTASTLTELTRDSLNRLLKNNNARLGDRQISPIPMKLTFDSHKIVICKFSYSSITLHESNLTGFFLFGNQRLRGEGKANDGKVLHRALSLAKTPDSDEFKVKFTKLCDKGVQSFGCCLLTLHLDKRRGANAEPMSTVCASYIL
uniref:Uncharacterized protein n=1 Tax=Glossina austeni TaxID=7395 RepID=A0A1A9V7G4_GLOAU